MQAFISYVELYFPNLTGVVDVMSNVIKLFLMNLNGTLALQLVSLIPITWNLEGSLFSATQTSNSTLGSIFSEFFIIQISKFSSPSGNIFFSFYFYLVLEAYFNIEVTNKQVSLLRLR